MSAPLNPALKRFLWDIQSMVELTDDAREILFIGADLMARLIATDDWLPEALAEAAPESPRTFQLFQDGDARFCVVASVLGPGQALPLLGAPFWQILGVLRGTVTLQPVTLGADGTCGAAGAARALGQGTVERLAPKAGAAFQVANGAAGPAIAIQVHGGEIASAPHFVTTPDGRLEASPFAYANGKDQPPHDIFSIQTIIED